MSEKFNNPEFDKPELAFKPCRIQAEYCNRFHIEHDALTLRAYGHEVILTYANTKMVLMIDNSNSFYSSPYNHIEIRLNKDMATAIQITKELEDVADYLMENEYPVLYLPVLDLLTLEWYENIAVGEALMELDNINEIIKGWESDDNN